MITSSVCFQFKKEDIKLKIEGQCYIYTCDYRVPRVTACPYFDGHFPGRPILPGVAIIDASLEYVRTIQDSPGLEIQGATSIKFLDLVGPDSFVELNAFKKGSDWIVIWLANKKKAAEIIFVLY
ncbi:MAG: hypothetical protein HQK52_21610 [Oligoflexia bacterium]|nr:hypothetical protein [Oligoflexia bacterium]